MADTPEWVRLSDQEVVLMARAGREAAYRELIRRYERPIFALLFRMVRDRELAEDLSQETFVKALNAIESYRPEFKFSSWIFKIANNAAIDHLRRRELDTLSLDGSPTRRRPRRCRPRRCRSARGRSRRSTRSRRRSWAAPIEIAIGRLRPEYRSCILLRHVEGRAYEEIAEMLDLPLGTVKTYIHRARNELRVYLEGVHE